MAARGEARSRGREDLVGYAFLAPYLALGAVFLAYPFGLGIWMSLHDWDLFGRASGAVFVGLGNYRAMLQDPTFWSSLAHTALFSALAVPAITAAGLGLALAVNGRTPFKAVLRGVFFASGVFSVTVVTLVWLTLLNPSRGLLGQLLQAAGLSPVDPLADRRLAMPALVLTTLWWSAGLPMALFLAGLQQIPRELHEAAALDHASRWAVFRRITWPALRRTTWLVVTVEVLLQFQVFGQVLLMTRGGPANSTRVLVQYIYESGFRDWRVGYAAALSLLLFALMLGASLAQARLTGQGRD